jgi:hypothetical protein
MGSFMLPVGEDAVEPLALLLGVVAYGLACNVAYTLGWIVEIYFFAHSREAGIVFRKKAFPVGLILSCMLPTTPVGWIVAWTVGRRLR